MSDDLFPAAPAPAPSRRTDPPTSHEAGEKIGPALPTIREQVLAFAELAGPRGFIDSDLVEAFPDRPESSYRKRRSELADENLLLDSGSTRANRHENSEIVWLHRQYVSQPPPLQEREAAPERRKLLAEGEAMAVQLGQWAESSRKEGRSFLASGLAEAARIMAALAK